MSEQDDDALDAETSAWLVTLIQAPAREIPELREAAERWPHASGP